MTALEESCLVVEMQWWAVRASSAALKLSGTRMYMFNLNYYICSIKFQYFLPKVFSFMPLLAAQLPVNVCGSSIFCPIRFLSPCVAGGNLICPGPLE